MTLFVLQFSVHLAKGHEFYVEYLLWCNQPADNTTMNHAGLWELVHE